MYLQDLIYQPAGPPHSSGDQTPALSALRCPVSFHGLPELRQLVLYRPDYRCILHPKAKSASHLTIYKSTVSSGTCRKEPHWTASMHQQAHLLSG